MLIFLNTSNYNFTIKINLLFGDLIFHLTHFIKYNLQSYALNVFLTNTKQHTLELCFFCAKAFLTRPPKNTAF